MGSITIIGEASADLLPDRVDWTVDVSEVDASSNAAFDRVTARVRVIADALAAFEVTTSQIRFSPEWHTHGHKTTGREVASAVLVVTAPLEQAASVATVAMDAGADELHGPQLRYPDATATLDALLPQAVEAARRNADAIAAAAGRRAGRVLAVTDPTARMDPEERRYARASAASGGGGDGRDVPVLPTPRRLSAALIVEIELTD